MGDFFFCFAGLGVSLDDCGMALVVIGTIVWGQTGPLGDFQGCRKICLTSYISEQRE